MSQASTIVRKRRALSRNVKETKPPAAGLIQYVVDWLECEPNRCSKSLDNIGDLPEDVLREIEMSQALEQIHAALLDAGVNVETLGITADVLQVKSKDLCGVVSSRGRETLTNAMLATSLRLLATRKVSRFS